MPKDTKDRLWIADLAMGVLSNPNADPDAIYNAKDIIRDLITKQGRMIIPQFTTADVRREKKNPSYKKKPPRALSAWQKFVKSRSKQPKFKKMKNASRLKAIGVAWRKTPAGRKKK